MKAAKGGTSEAASLQRLVAVARRDAQAGADALRRHCIRPEADDRMEAALGARAAGALQVVALLDGAEWRPTGFRALRRLWAGSVRLLVLAPLDAPTEAEAVRLLVADVGAGHLESTDDLAFLGYVTYT